MKVLITAIAILIGIFIVIDWIGNQIGKHFRNKNNEQK